MLEYTSKLLPATALTESPDGRSMKGLRYQIDLLSSSPSTAADADELRDLQVDMSVCAALRHYLSLSDDDLLTAVQHMTKRLDIAFWPADLVESLVTRLVVIARGKDAVDDVFVVTFPFGAGKFDLDPLSARLASLPNASIDHKISLSERLLFKETVVPLVQRGKEGFSTVLKLCKLAIPGYEKVDPTMVNSGIMTTVGVDVGVRLFGDVVGLQQGC